MSDIEHIIQSFDGSQGGLQEKGFFREKKNPRRTLLDLDLKKW